MAVIWQSSAFWLMICTVLLVLIGCTVLRNRFHAPQVIQSYDVTIIPSLTSTSLPPDTIQLIETATPFDFVTNNIFQRSTSPPPDSNIVIGSPNCYELAGGNYDCLGKIWNFTEGTIGDTSIEIEIFDGAGARVASQQTASEQRLTESGGFATYRAIINSENLDSPATSTVISASLMDSLDPSPAIQNLSITESAGHITLSGLYHLSLTIRNDSSFEAQDIRIFTTLDNTEWGIVGYDVNEVVFSLQNGENQEIELNVIPFALPPQIEHVIHVEAVTIPD